MLTLAVSRSEQPPPWIQPTPPRRRRETVQANAKTETLLWKAPECFLSAFSTHSLCRYLCRPFFTICFTSVTETPITRR